MRQVESTSRGKSLRARELLYPWRQAATAALGLSKGNEAMEMYDTEMQRSDALRRQQERTVHAWMRAAAYAAGTEEDDDVFASREPFLVEMDLGRAVESKKRDNLALGEALVSIGLIGHRELSELESAQAENKDLVGSLLVASAIRSRLGEILLTAKRVTSSQLEFALEMQRHQGGLLGEILVSLGWLDRQTLDAALAAQADRKAA
jgi:hypothetical protein